MHETLGTAGFVIAIVALVAALTGVAYAASGGLSSKQKKEVEKISKKFAGKNGVPGAQGPAGTQGGPGVAGKAGSTGATGQTGFTATLPPKATEKGVWGMGHIEDKEKYPGPGGRVLVPISFPIPLANDLELSQVHLISKNDLEVNAALEEVASTTCEGTAAEPTAKPGNLCIYSTTEVTTLEPANLKNVIIQAGSASGFLNPGTDEGGSSASGMDLKIEAFENGAEAYGTWAVTAE